MQTIRRLSRQNEGKCRAFTRTSPLRLAAAAAASAAVFSGCMVGPDYSRPDALVNAEWVQSQDGISAEPVHTQWWEEFSDPTLTRLIERARARNLSLRAAGLVVLEARAARGIAVAQFFPQLQEFFGGVDANQVSRNSANSGGDRSFSTAELGLQAAWELDFWGRFRRGIEAADAELLASVADYDAVLVSLIGDVATNYVLVRSLEERLEFARANVALQTETLSLTETRFRLGKVSELDVSTARATLANTQAGIPDLEAALTRTRLALCVLLGRTPSQLEEELAPAPGLARTVPESPAKIAAGVPAELLRRRPDVRAAERIAAAQSARIGQATADLYPRISIVGATGFASSTFDGSGGSPNLGNIFDADSFTGFIGLRVNWPVFDYGTIRGNIRVQDARYERAVAEYQETVLRAAAEVESGLSDFLRAREATGYLREAVDASNRSVELSLIQYRTGAVDFIRVNDAQSSLVQQQDALVVARAAIAVGAIRTYRALGGGWQTREGREFIDPDTAERMRRRTNWGDIMKHSWSQGKDLGFDRPAEDQDAAGGSK